MTFRKLFIITSALLILLAVAVGLTSINHPIILKWVAAGARHYGKPTPATIYTNGLVNNNSKVYYSDEPNSYLLSLAADDSSGSMQFFNINVKEKWIGKGKGTSKDDYDLIAGHLFLTRRGGSFSPLRNGMKGSAFDPQLTYKDKQITFNMPPNTLKFDSVRIVLP